jgi:putative lipoic acid-binding regulatory protein
MAFPVSFSLRVIGRNVADFPALVVELVSRHALEVDATALVTRPSRDGNYISVLLPVRLESRVHYEAVFRELNEHEAVILVI